MSALPRCVALRSKHDKSYLRSVHDESYGGSLIELGHGDGGIMNPRARFYLEPSKEHEGLIHVRCCYNNKYWVPQQRVLDGGSTRWVIGTADEPEEDLSKPSCTLLKHIFVAGEQPEDDGSTCRFLHSKLGKYACVSSTRSYMHIASHEDQGERQDGGGLIDTFTLLDVSDQKQLPSHLAFKGHNDRFLVGIEYCYHNSFQFSGEDIGDSRALFTISTNDDGLVRIKSNYFGNYLWTNNSGNPHGIVADETDMADDDPWTLFKVTTVDDFLALRLMGNNRFCALLHKPGIEDFLCAADENQSVTNEAKLKWYEPVLSREIYDVDFRLSEARIHTKGIDGLDTQTVKNRTSTTNKQTLTFTYKNTMESTWSATLSVKLSVNVSLNCGVPIVADGKIETSFEFSGSYTWGKTESEEKEISKQIEVDVPPMKKVTVKAIGSNGACDIPFSYKQRDVLTNGQVVTQVFTDGMYYGVKTSSITFEVIEEDL